MKKRNNQSTSKITQMEMLGCIGIIVGVSAPFTIFQQKVDFISIISVLIAIIIGIGPVVFTIKKQIQADKERTYDLSQYKYMLLPDGRELYHYSYNIWEKIKRTTVMQI